MRATHIGEEMACTTTRLLLAALPENVRKDRQQHPAVVAEWVAIMETEFRGYQFREDMGQLVRQV